SANGVEGTGATQGTGTDTGSFTGDSYANLLVKEGRNDDYRVIDSHDNNTLTITGVFTDQPISGDTWEVFDWGTSIDRIDINVTSNVILEDLNLSMDGTSSSLYYRSSFRGEVHRRTGLPFIV
ncbi:unnamed protein product, partial [marine sediment metagenome]